MQQVDDASLKHRRELAAERMRRTRERQRAGLLCCYVDVAGSEVSKLVRRGLLAAEDAECPYRVGEAVAELLGRVLA